MTTQKIRGKIQTRIYLDDLIDVVTTNKVDGATLEYRESDSKYILQDSASSGWKKLAVTVFSSSNNSFSIAGDVTLLFPVGSKLKITDTTTKYFYVTSAVFVDLEFTLVSITAGSDYTLAANPTEIWVSYASTPQGFPGKFNWTPTWIGYSTPPEVGKAIFSIDGRVATITLEGATDALHDAAIPGISNSSANGISIPVVPEHRVNGVVGYAVDNGVVITTACAFQIQPGQETVYFAKSMSFGSGAWTNSGEKVVEFTISFIINDGG